MVEFNMCFVADNGIIIPFIGGKYINKLGSYGILNKKCALFSAG